MAMTKLEALLEAEKKGILSNEQMQFLQSARRRKLLPDAENVPTQQMSWREVPIEAFYNTGKSAYQFAADIANAVLHPIDTLKGVTDIGSGVISKGVEKFVKQDPKVRAKNEAALDAMIEYFKGEYGGEENLKNKIAKDPVGFLTDVSTVLTGGGGLFSKLGKISSKLKPLEKVGEIVNKTGGVIDPLNAIPLTYQGASNVYEKGKNFLSSPPTELEQFSYPARKRLLEVYKQSNLNPEIAAQRGRELGSRSFLADYNQGFTDLAEGIVQHPGGARDMVSDAYTNRFDTAQQTIKDALDANMGKPVNVPVTEKAIEKYYGELASPLYKEFHPSVVPETKDISEILKIINKTDPEIFKEAKNLAVYERIPEQYISRLVPDEMSALTGGSKTVKTKQWTGAELDFMRRALSRRAAMLKDSLVSKDRTMYRNYSTLANELNRAIDKAVSPKNPSKSIYAQAREFSGEGLGAGYSMREGQKAFGSGLSADQLAMDQAGRTGLEQTAYQVGAREALRSKMDTSATQFGSKGDKAARTALNSTENQRKLAMIIGDLPAENIMKNIRSENEFAENANRILANSATSRRQQLAKIVPGQLETAQMERVAPNTLTGLTSKAFQKIINAVTMDKLNERNARIATDMARALISQGADSQYIIRGLEDLKNRQGMTQQRSKYIENIIGKLSEPSYQSGRAERVLSETARSVPLVEDENSSPNPITEQDLPRLQRSSELGAGVAVPSPVPSNVNSELPLSPTGFAGLRGGFMRGQNDRSIEDIWDEYNKAG